MKDQKKRISILGDSVSTFAGITPPEALFYDAWRQEETGGSEDAGRIINIVMK